MNEPLSRTPEGLSRLNLLREIAVSMRPSHWTKNAVVFAAFVFAYWDSTRTEPLSGKEFLLATAAFCLFCLVSSGIYILNDLHDAPMDRFHPLKKHRPIASGRVPPSVAGIAAALLLSVSLALGTALSLKFAATAAGYVAMQIIYTMFLKKIPFVDALVIAAGFVLRAVAGAFALHHVSISNWLLLCAFLLSLFLALCKRRSELAAIGAQNDHKQRPALLRYHQRAADILIAMSGAAAFISYVFYSLWPGTIAKFQTKALVLTTPLVALGLLRYAHLVYKRRRGERPEEILLTDIPLILIIILYAVATLAALHFRP